MSPASIVFKTVAQIAVYTCLLIASNQSIAQTKVVVIPMGGADLQPLKNVITVAKENGDFNSPAAAMDAIGSTLPSATESNPYLVVIAPGFYTLLEPLQMQEYVEISGSGQFVTILSGFIGASIFNKTASIIIGADNTSLRDLTVQNLGSSGNNFSMCIFNDDVSPIISNVRFNMYGNNQQYCIRNQSAAAPVISHVTINLANGTAQIGISNGNATPTISDVVIQISGGTTSIGITNYGNTLARISNASITVSGGSTSNTGIHNTSSDASAVIRGSTISATTSIAANTGFDANETYVSDSFLEGIVTGSPQCSFVFKPDGSSLNLSCL